MTRKGNGRPQESALGHSQKIVAGVMKMRQLTDGSGDGRVVVATELLKLAMETDGERKARLKKMVATTQLRLAPETEDERRVRLEYLSDNPIYIPNNLYLILIIAF